jgi:sugar lactone lactonase YvrE
VAVDGKGDLYEIQRGDNADPILVLNSKGKVLRSWGKGDFELPHSIRIDPSGNIWAVDSGSSVVIEYSPQGHKLMTIHVGEQPKNGSAFHGATDIAFGPDGRIFIADGYGNARILEYAADGSRIKEWGKPGAGPGEFHLPHAIQIDTSGTIYVADRENGRIEKFDLEGNYLGAIAHLGRIYSFKLANGVLWATMGSFKQPPGSQVWLVELDPVSGKILGHFDVPGERAGHCIEQMSSGEIIMTHGNELLLLKAK